MRGACLLALALALAGLGSAALPAAEAVRALDAAGPSDVELRVPASPDGATGTAGFGLRVTPGGPVRLLVLPVPGNAAYGNGTAAAGWWTEARSARDGEAPEPRGGTAGPSPLPLGDWEGGALHRLELGVRLPPGAAVAGRAYRLHYAVAAPEAGGGAGSGGEYEASLGLTVRITVVAAQAAAPAPAAPPQDPPATATATATDPPPTTSPPPGPDSRARDGDPALPSPPTLQDPWLGGPWRDREVLLLAALMLALGYLVGSRRRGRSAASRPAEAPAASAPAVAGSPANAAALATPSTPAAPANPAPSVSSAPSAPSPVSTPSAE